jgi:ribulose-5-phosphate 4-epimerase/fuculose-1-phosphate aldolase
MTLSKESQAREDICRVGKSLFDRGYVQGAAGNISVALESGFLITPTDACLGFLEPAKLARLDRNKEQVSGDKASKTIALHASIYTATAPFMTPVGCIIHTHSTHCVALSLQSPSVGLLGSELLRPLTPYFVMKVGHVPIISYHRPGDPAAAHEVAQTIKAYGERGTPIRAVMLPRLGPNVWANSPMQAMAVLEELEETAKLACLQPHTAPLTDAEIDDLRQTFGTVW